ncbi:MAG TPA: OmpA family protein [Polyangia bacterium]|jgi:OOP family OmpA-OmpF porin
MNSVRARHLTSRPLFLFSLVPSLVLSTLALAGTALAQDAPAAPPAATSVSSETIVSKDSAPREFRYELGLTGGVHFFDSQSGLGRFTSSPPDLSPKTSFAMGLRLALNFNHWVSVEGEALWIPTHTVLDPGGTAINVFAYRGSVVFHIIPRGPVRPFILAGFGGLSSISNNTTLIGSDNDDFFHAGAGVKIALGEHAGIRLDGRVMAPPAFLAKSSNSNAVGDETGFHGPDWEVLGGVYLNFGEIQREVTTTVSSKEVVVMAAAPNPDPDGDGIAGTADKCPNVAEDKDGFEDDDGCPDPDNDKDGIPDAQDKCPDQPETFNGIDDEDGCPEIDTDGDGILGSRDKCPDEPETVNGYKDDDGCPDEIPAAVKKFTGVIQGINFKTNQSTILEGSYAILDQAVAVLKEFPDIRLEVGGHTDSVGKADYNRDLSQRRADSVKLYLVGKGIDASRLTAVGYGLDRPIADNGTESGRSKNRRTEFKLLIGEDGKPAAPGAPATAVPAAPPAGKAAPFDSGPPPAGATPMPPTQ